MASDGIKFAKAAVKCGQAFVDVRDFDEYSPSVNSSVRQSPYDRQSERHARSSRRSSQQASSGRPVSCSRLSARLEQSSKVGWSKASCALSKGGSAAQLVGAGGVLVCDFFRAILDEHEVDLAKPVDAELVKAITDVAERTEEHDKAVEDLLTFYASKHGPSCQTWESLRDESITKLKDLADTIDWHHRNVNITNVTASAVGISATVVTVAAGIAAFFTLGGTAPIAVGAAAVGATSGLTGLGASLTEMGLTNSVCSEAQKCINADQELTVQLYTKIDRMYECAEKLQVSTEKLDKWDGLEVARTVFVSISSAGTVVSSVPALAKFVAKLTKVHKVVWVAKCGSKLGKALPSLKSLNLVKQFPSIMGKGAARVFGKALTAVGFVLDVYSLITTSIDLAKGSVTETGTTLRGKVEELQKEKTEVAKLIEKLKESQEEED